MDFNFLEEAAQTPITTYIVMGVILLAIIGLFVWQTISGKKKQKEAQEQINSLKIGDKIKTIGGVCGYLVQINDDENTFILETGLGDDKCYIKFDKQAIYQTAHVTSSDKKEEAGEVKAEEEKAE